MQPIVPNKRLVIVLNDKNISFFVVGNKSIIEKGTCLIETWDQSRINDLYLKYPLQILLDSTTFHSFFLDWSKQSFVQKFKYFINFYRFHFTPLTLRTFYKIGIPFLSVYSLEKQPLWDKFFNTLISKKATFFSIQFLPLFLFDHDKQGLFVQQSLDEKYYDFFILQKGLILFRRSHIHFEKKDAEIERTLLYVKSHHGLQDLEVKEISWPQFEEKIKNTSFSHEMVLDLNRLGIFKSLFLNRCQTWSKILLIPSILLGISIFCYQAYDIYETSYKTDQLLLEVETLKNIDETLLPEVAKQSESFVAWKNTLLLQPDFKKTIIALSQALEGKAVITKWSFQNGEKDWSLSFDVTAQDETFKEKYKTLQNISHLHKIHIDFEESQEEGYHYHINIQGTQK